MIGVRGSRASPGPRRRVWCVGTARIVDRAFADVRRWHGRQRWLCHDTSHVGGPQVAGDTHNEFSGQASFVIQGRDFAGDIILAPTPVTGIADEDARALALAVHAQWRHEAGLRGLVDPTPIPTGWQAVWGDVADHPENVGQEVSGDTGNLADLTRTFRGLRRRRLVILGGAGSGKTSLAVLLLLELLDTARPDEPVPLLLSVASWEPKREHLKTWMARRIVEEYPGIKVRGAKRLIANRRVLPVLDGLDEIASKHRATALWEISRAVRGGDPMILTCRQEEYTEAVAQAGGVIGSTAVVSAVPLSPSLVAAHLRRCVPPGALPRWMALMDHLTSDPTGAVASASSTPLMVSLIRGVYANPNRDPDELLDTARFPDQDAIENHLLDAVIPAVFEDGPGFHDPQRPPTRRWPQEKAERWLTFLAGTLTTMRTQDFAWWQLPRENTPMRHSAWCGLVALFWWTAAVLAIGWLTGAATRSQVGLVLVGVLMVVPAAVLVTRPILPKGHPRKPGDGLSDGELEDAKPWLVVLWALGGGVGGWGFILLLSLMLGGRIVPAGPGGIAIPPPGEDLTIKIDYSWNFVLGLLCVMVSVTGLVMFMILNHDFASVPGMTTGSPGKAVLRQARRGAVVTTLSVSALFAAPLAGLVVMFDFSPFGLGAMAIIAVTFGLLSYSRSAFGAYFRVRRRLAAAGALPWRLTAFLEDAHRLGVLRQSGTMYQFRHGRLRDRLVTRAGKNSSSR
ncbi:NACHT domain-containing protein [Amycolatopsis japonica]|uniref:NACHT domain-containing protein n=1 Tax=Amycolatopsis japonica TaxID=208439 RepID=UPI003318836D